MSVKDMFFAALLLLGGYFYSAIMQGAYLNGTDADIMNSLMLFRTWNAGGFFSVPILNVNFFLEGIPRLLMWDFAFFGDQYAAFQYLFYTFSIAIAWGVAITFIGVRVWSR